MLASLQNEKLILLAARSPFVVKCFGTASLAESVLFFLEPLLGGELYATYNRQCKHGDVACARYYTACVATALKHLHGLHVVCRGLKPEDCVLDTTGRLKLVDMGLAKVVVGKTYTTCGTPDYFAPEVIASTGHNWGYDWWCVGILLFELLTGAPPFEAAYPMKIYSKVMGGIGRVVFPAAAQGEAKDLIVGLLNK